MSGLNKKTAIVLFNIGAPDDLKSVRPFLANFLDGPSAIGILQPLRSLLATIFSIKKMREVREIYSKISDKQSLLDITLTQAYSLEKELSFSGDFKVIVAMKCWKPFAKDAALEVIKYNPDQIILLPLYSQFSVSKSDASIKEFAEKFFYKQRRCGKDIPTKVVCCYPKEENFIKSHSFLIEKTIAKHYDGDIKKFRFLFSAPGISKSSVEKGDPYLYQIRKTSEAVISNLSTIFNFEKNDADFKVCYQLKIGWSNSSPKLGDEIKKVALENKIPVLIPISSVSDSFETLFDLDVFYKEIAKKFGIKNYLRVPSLNSDGNFIKSLADICKKVDQDDDYSVFSGSSNVRMCPNHMKLCFNKNICK